MTPAARAAAAIEVLDEVLAGKRTEAVMASWAGRNRYAGSSDRSAIRDHAYDALRRKRSLAAWGGAETGRGLILGVVREAAADPATVFGADRYAPAPLTDAERHAPVGPWPEAVALDCPDVLLPLLRRALGDRLVSILRLMRERAEVHLRANAARVAPAELCRRLEREGVEAEPHPLSPCAVLVQDGARRLRRTDAYANGLFELQDAASQAVADAVPIRPGARVLDYCAGAGGKVLAMAARADASWFAHDAHPERMADLPDRARRAGCRVDLLSTEAVRHAGPFDVVMVDAPCSGSGTWRRDPEAKWSLTANRLNEVRSLQESILDDAQDLVAPGGVLAYATCSMLLEENEWQVAAFRRRHDGWRLRRTLRLSPLEGGDGFYLALLSR